MKKNIINLQNSVLCFLLLTITAFVHAETSFLPGLVPTEYGLAPASDLIYNGKMLTSDEAHQLYLGSNGKMDLSLLNPDDSSPLWKNLPPRALNIHDNSKEIKVNADDLLKYMDQVPSRSGNFRFTVSADHKAYTIMLSKNIHNVLLKKSLLQKLGYTTPPIKYLPKIKLKFTSSMEKELFMEKMAESTFGDPGRWIINYRDHLRAKKDLEEVDENKDNNDDEDKDDEEEKEESGDDGIDPDDENEVTVDGPLADSDELLLQDLIIMEDQNHLYNLAIGYLPSQVIQGRRVLNSLLIPYSLVEVPESLNLFAWHVGRVVNKQIDFGYESAEEFTTSYEDARWIARRVLKLTRADFEEIVANAYYPEAVAALLVEKLLSRRNHLAKILNLENESSEIAFDPEITIDPYLRDGKIIKEKWEGYASRFSYGDPNSPLSRSELFAFAKSKFISTGISNLITLVNKHLPHTDIESALFQRQEDLFFKQLAEYAVTGKVTPVPLGIWATPIAGINLIASREIIAGSYLGTDNVIQLADSVGLSVDAGAYLRVEGMQYPISVTGKAMATINRIYSHLRPIKSFKAGLRYPYKNLFVPYFQRKLGHFFDEILTGDFEKLQEKERKKILEEMMFHFKEQMQVGESILISDAVGGGVNLAVGSGYTRMVEAQAAFGASLVVLSRLHIHRKDENTIQIYKDLGNVTSLVVSFQLKTLIPVLSVSAKWSKGSAKCKFYSLNINENEKENPHLIKNLKALRTLFLNNSLELASTVKKPYRLINRFTQGVIKGNVLFFQAGRMTLNTKLTIIHPSGARRDFFRAQAMKRRGLNFEQFSIDAVNSILRDYAEWDMHLDRATGDSPADSIKGSSLNMTVNYEGEIKNKRGEKGDIENRFALISKTWRGWSISRESAENIIKQINQKFKIDFYPENALAQTNKIFLYNISMEIYLYEKALLHFMNLKESKVSSIFSRHVLGVGDLIKKWRFMHEWRSAKNDLRWNNYMQEGKHMRLLLSMAHSWLGFDGLLELFGGKDNMFIISKLSGFRVGDEAGDTPLMSHTLGEIGSRALSGPLAQMQNQINATQSEFLAYWLIERLQ
ncbi:MAG: hypothetical protein HQK50_16930 [Oligoflexia bacterium]|nr:hypothetical protein [Oligoflexia bacterium]MBF0367264.1 hypothetical protein [Oligoflexia bacterium]